MKKEKGYKFETTASNHEAEITMRNGLRIRYWAPPNGGYVREVTSKRPGNLGQQVGETLSHSGDMLYWSPSNPPLTKVLQGLMRRKACREHLELRDQRM